VPFDINPVDLLAIVLLAATIIVGFRSGALPQVGGLVGAGIGGGAALLILPRLNGPLSQLDPAIRAIAVLAGLLFAVGAGEGIGSALGSGVGRRLAVGVLGVLDRVAGGFVGAAQGIFIVWLAGGLLAAGPIPNISQQTQNSVVVRTVDRYLPPPTAVVVELGHLLDASGLPDVFVGLDPLPQPPIALPSNPRARAIFEGAAASTVKVVAGTCNGLESTGTGFVIARGYVVTNAHVVAGDRTIRVDAGGTLFDATAVLFDSKLDVALLRVAKLGSSPIAFAADDPKRGAIGVALGHPEGAALTAIPGAVDASYDATGLDIYGSTRVTRRILELHAAIRKGDSGGPFVLENGTVGGVVFAESRTDPTIGYALSPTAVAVRVNVGIGATRTVSTGPCTN
jgi:S1-C subfamily serine protease